MDALCDVLRVVRLNGAIYLDGEFAAPWNLGRWRLQVAAQRLRSSDQPLAVVAEDVGNDSEAAFNRAFKRGFGMPPATWRRRRAQQAPTPVPAGSASPS